MSLFTFLRESTWGYPIISAVHVLGIAWFGGTVLVSQFAPDMRGARRVGIALLLVSGVVLFWLHPAQYSASMSFRIKILLIVALLCTNPARSASLVLWAAVIFASRSIAFW